jgi:hypothetical protein
MSLYELLPHDISVLKKPLPLHLFCYFLILYLLHDNIASIYMNKLDLSKEKQVRLLLSISSILGLMIFDICLVGS